MRRTGRGARLVTAAALVAAAALSRLAPHPPNFTPVAAMALFAGATIEPAALAFGVPLLAMLASDAVLGFHDQMPGVYLSFALTVLLGRRFRRPARGRRLVLAAPAASLLFFVLTNLGVWAAGGLYPRTAAGLLECYVLALPFFGSTILGDALYAAALFGGYALLHRDGLGVRRVGAGRPAGD